MRKIVLLTFLLTSALLVSSVFAQSYNQWFDTRYIADMLRISDSYLQGTNILWDLIIPFIAIMAICLGFLRTLRIFRNSAVLEGIIAFCMAFATLPSGIFVVIVNFMLGFSGTVAVVMFFAMFLVGVVLYSINWIGGTASAGSVERKLRDAYKRRAQLDEKMANLRQSTNPKDKLEINRLARERTAVDNYIKDLEAQLEGISSARAAVWEKKEGY